MDGREETAAIDHRADLRPPGGASLAHLLRGACYGVGTGEPTRIGSAVLLHPLSATLPGENDGWVGLDRGAGAACCGVGELPTGCGSPKHGTALPTARRTAAFESNNQ